MTTERWKSVKGIFQHCLDLPEDQRAEWLQSACGDDAELRADVESLLKYHSGAGQFLEIPAVVPGLDGEMSFDPESPAQGDLLGVYRVVQKIGEGGMSVVYQGVRDDDEYRQLVAIKILKRGMDTDFLVRRFRKERQILAHCDHPNIARIFDGGSTPDGRPYFVMEFIAGQPIDQYCDSHRLNLRERLELFLRVCNAVEYAHQNLVVHRDLKPSNILVTEDGQPKLLDFGIAKLLEDDRDITVSYIRLMTPEYASPEQAAGGAITTRSDIYSLGVILFELLAGEKPYKRSARGMEQEDDSLPWTTPPRPSTSISRAADSIIELRGARRERLRRALEDDIDNIVAMAIRKEPEARYAAVGQMAMDIRRHFAGEPIVARKDAMGYRMRKFVQRHRTVVAATAAVIVALTVGIVIALHNLGIANEQRAAAERRYDLVRGLTTSMVGEVHEAIAPLAGSTAARELIVTRAEQYLDRLSRENGPSVDKERAEVYLRIGDLRGNPGGPNLGDVQGALVNYRRALELNRKLAAESPEDSKIRTALATSHRRICVVQNRLGDFKAALESCAETVRLSEDAVRSDPTNLDFRGDLGIAYGQLADPYFSMGNWNRAREFGEKALTTYGQLAGATKSTDENKKNWLKEIAGAHNFLASVEEQAQRFALARIHAEKAVTGYEAEAAAHPNDAFAQLQPTFAMQRMGSILMSMGDLKGALAAFEKGLPIREQLVAVDTKDLRARLSLARSHNSLGYTLLKLGEPQKALEHFQVEEKLATELVQKDAAAIEHQTILASANEDIGSVWMYYAERGERGARRDNWSRARPFFARALAIADALEARGALRADYNPIHERFKAEVAACDRALGP